MDRKLDGIFVRIQRGVKWENVCLSDMTLDQRRKFTESLSDEGKLHTIDHLCECLKYIGDEYDIVGGREE